MENLAEYTPPNPNEKNDFATFKQTFKSVCENKTSTLKVRWVPKESSPDIGEHVQISLNISSLKGEKQRLYQECGYIGLNPETSRAFIKAVVGPKEAAKIDAAPAYAKAWALVPQDIKDSIFDTLHDEAWQEAAIAKAEGRS